MDNIKYVGETPKAVAKIITSVKIDHDLYRQIYEIKGAISMTKLIEALLKRFVEENKKS